jgi:Zn finger protein HypA/HybF involved in hydrogenase expression
MKRAWTDEQFIKAVNNNYSKANVLRDLGLAPIGGNYKTVDKHIARLQLTTNHFTGQGWNQKGKTCNSGRPLSEVLQKDTYRANSHLRIRLIKEEVFKNECSICQITNWLNKPLTFHLDHINGDNADNRLENLRLLCPNCHAQTDTYCGLNKKGLSSAKNQRRRIKRHPKPKPPRPTNYCPCGTRIHPSATNCKSCVPKTTKIDWPTTEILLDMVSKSSYREVGKRLDVSDNAIRKRIRNH